MKLSEKIYHCRKKCGYSQETLAQALGISRQAISKWETGESEPEIGKLKLLAEVFGVTTDWLLSEEDPEETEEEPDSKKEIVYSLNLPGSIGKFFRKHGWISGLIILVYGCLAVGIGFLARMGSQKILGNIPMPEDAVVHNPVEVLATAVLIFGAVLIVGGAVLAIYLKHRYKAEG